MSEFLQLSKLPDDLINVITNRLHSHVEVVRFRSICKFWRSAVSINKKRFHNRNRKRILSPYNGNKCALSPAAYFRVILSSYPNKGWLIKTQDVSESGKKQLLSPLSRVSIKSTEQTLDLLDYTVSEIHQSYDIQYLDSYNYTVWCNFARVVTVKDLVFAVTHDKQIWCVKSGEQESNENAWTRIINEEVELFSDIIVHKDQVYALDLNGAIWWISKSERNIFQFGPPTPMDEYDIDLCKDKRFVECRGDICIVHRFCKIFRVKRVDIEKTIGFKVYKMDEELCEWAEVKSLGDLAFVMAADSCFSVSASEYYGCLKNSIYFTDEEERNNVKVFKLGDCIGNITKMVESSYDSCFQMLSPPFV